VSPAEVPFLDLSRQESELGDRILEAFQDLLTQGKYILGPQLSLLEEEFASYCGCSEGIGVASGTDALVLALKALGLRDGDEVLVPAFSAPPTGVAIALAGARPVFVDIAPQTKNIDPRLIEERMTSRSRFLVVVHLYGCLADMPQLMAASERLGLILVEDCAQAHGAFLHGRMAGSWGQAGCYSFYPTKNLGGYGDGGMVVTDDAGLAQRLRSLRNYGKTDRDRLEEIGVNSRLDELQAALLRVKLELLPAWNERRRELARRYLDGLAGLPLELPSWDGSGSHCFHLFVVECDNRDALRQHLEARGIGSVVHYPIPLHLQPPLRDIQISAVPCPVSEHIAGSVLSLPLYPQMTDGEIELVIESIREFFKA
jgi:dTDP-4-amino-4,6-dideoxygalactose transaminase